MSKALFRFAIPVVSSVVSTSLLLYILFRNFFNNGMLVYPDLFQLFSAFPDNNYLTTYFSAWNPGSLGGPNTGTLPLYPLLWILSKFGINGVESEAVFVVSLLTLASLSLALFVRHITHSIVAMILSVTIYLLSPQLFIEIFNGSGGFTFYCFSPLLFTASYWAFLEGRRKLNVGLLMGVIGFSAFFSLFNILWSIPVVFPPFLIGFVSRQGFRSRFLILLELITSYIGAVLLNAPVYFGDLFQFVPGLGKLGNFYPQFLNSYQWATPLRTWILLGGGIYVRYSAFYAHWWTELLYVLPLLSISVILFVKRMGKKRFASYAALAMMFLSYSEIVGIHFGLFPWVFHYFPILYVFNYPEALSITLNLSYGILVPIAVASFADHYAKYPHVFSIKKSIKAHGDGIAALVSVLIIISLVLPASFYIADGNFEQSRIMNAIGMPPQWTAVAPKSFYGIFSFLASHGGLYQERPLILPFPGFQGGQDFRGFYPFLFDPSEFAGTPPLFGVAGSSQSFATSVLNALITNSTNMIGIPLGLASVKYIIVDRALDFQGPPYWTWSSLVGAPNDFIKLLSWQKDLHLTFENSTMAVYLNLDYKPYIQSYGGLMDVHYSNTSLPNRTIYGENLNASNETLSSARFGGPISSIMPIEHGFLINNTGDAGVLNVTFHNSTYGGYVEAIASGPLNNYGIDMFFQNQTVPVGNSMYQINYTETYSGAESHGAFVTIVGENESHNVIWGKSIFAQSINLPTRKLTAGLDFNPISFNASTSYLSVYVTFQNYLNQPGVSELNISNITLAALSPNPPQPALSSLIPYEIPNGYGFSEMVTVPTTGSAEQHFSAGSNDIVNNLFINQVGAHNGSIRENSSYLLTLSNIFQSTEGYFSFVITPSGVGGYSIKSLSLVNGTITPFPLFSNRIFILAEGKGDVRLTLTSGDQKQNGYFYVDSNTLKWYSSNVTDWNVISDANLSVAPNITVNSIFISNVKSQENSFVTHTSNNMLYESNPQPWLFDGKMISNDSVIFLSQSFNTGWSLQFGKYLIRPKVGFGWGNIFVIPHQLSSLFHNTTFTISYAPESSWLAFVYMQIAGWIIWMILLSYLYYFGTSPHCVLTLVKRVKKLMK